MAVTHIPTTPFSHNWFCRKKVLLFLVAKLYGMEFGWVLKTSKQVNVAGLRAILFSTYPHPHPSINSQQASVRCLPASDSPLVTSGRPGINANIAQPISLPRVCTLVLFIISVSGCVSLCYYFFCHSTQHNSQVLIPTDGGLHLLNSRFSLKCCNMNSKINTGLPQLALLLSIQLTRNLGLRFRTLGP